MYVRINPEGKTLSEVVKILPHGKVGVYVKDEEKLLRALREEHELQETLRTGLNRKARGVRY